MIDPSKLQELMQQAQQMQDQMTSQLKTRVVTGEAGGGLVKVTMNGMLEVTAVKIEPSCVDSLVKDRDVTLLEDLVRAAVSAAVKKVEEARMEGAKNMAGSMGLPPGMF